MDALGHLPALHVTPANADDRAEVGRLAEAAAQHGVQLEPVELPEAKRGFGPAAQAMGLGAAPQAERSGAWATRFRRLVRDYERSPQTVAGPRFVASARLMLHRIAPAQRP